MIIITKFEVPTVVQTCVCHTYFSWKSHVTLIENTTLVRSCSNADTTVENVNDGIHFLNHTSCCSADSDQILLPHLANYSVSLLSVNLLTEFHPPSVSPTHKDAIANERLVPFEPENLVLEGFLNIFSELAFILVMAVFGLLIYFKFSKPAKDISLCLGVLQVKCQFNVFTSNCYWCYWSYLQAPSVSNG